MTTASKIRLIVLPALLAGGFGIHPGVGLILAACLLAWIASGMPDNAHQVTGIEAAVCADIARRQQLGIQKYGQTVAENPLDLKAWLQHAYEESLDLSVYLKRAMQEMEAKEGSTDAR